MQGDLELLQQSVSRSQEQHSNGAMRLDEATQALARELGLVKSRLEGVEGGVSSLRVELMDAKDSARLQQRDGEQRYEHLRTMVRSFGEALGLGAEGQGPPAQPPQPGAAGNV